MHCQLQIFKVLYCLYLQIQHSDHKISAQYICKNKKKKKEKKKQLISFIYSKRTVQTTKGPTGRRNSSFLLSWRPSESR